MTEKNKLLIDLLLQNKTLNEIKEALKESPKQIQKRLISLKGKGYVFDPNYNDNGNITYTLEKEITQTLENTITINPKENKIKVMTISDIHIGNELENLKLLDTVYRHCLDNDIHIIFNCGDTIDGTHSYRKQLITDPKKQAEKLIKKHPYDKEILNFICFGNHEASALYDQGFNIKEVLKNSRPDLIPVGYGLGIINILEEQIILKHNIEDLRFGPTPHKLILCGHTHKLAYKMQRDSITVLVPPLSDLCFNGQNHPGALQMELTFANNDLLSKIRFSHYKVDENKTDLMSETDMEFAFKKRKIKEKDIKQ